MQKTILADIESNELNELKLECFEGLAILQNEKLLSRSDGNKLATLFQVLGAISNKSNKLSNHFEALSCITVKDGLDVEAVRLVQSLQNEILKISN